MLREVAWRLCPVPTVGRLRHLFCGHRSRDAALRQATSDEGVGNSDVGLMSLRTYGKSRIEGDTQRINQQCSNCSCVKEAQKEERLTLKLDITCGTISDPPNAAIVLHISGVEVHSSRLMLMLLLCSCSSSGCATAAACTIPATTSRDSSSIGIRSLLRRVDVIF